MHILKEYIRLAITESKDLEPEERYTYEDLLGLFKYLRGKRRAKFLINFSIKVLGGSVIEDILGKAAGELGIKAGKLTGAKLASVLDSEITSELIEKKLFGFLKDKLNISGKDLTPARILGKFYGVNEKPGLKGLSIPDVVSNLIDDDFEGEFIVHLIDLIEKLPNKKLYVTSNWVLSQLLEFANSRTETRGAFEIVAKQKGTEF